jgi:Tetratricopeptide repeat
MLADDSHSPSREHRPLDHETRHPAEPRRESEAIANARSRIELIAETYGTNHPEFATALNQLALLYILPPGDPALAEPLLRQALEVRRQALGQNHPDYATNLSSLGGLLWARGDLTAAEPLLRQAAEIRCYTLGPGHPKSVVSLNSLDQLVKARHELVLQALDAHAMQDSDPFGSIAASNMSAESESASPIADGIPVSASTPSPSQPAPKGPPPENVVRLGPRFRADQMVKPGTPFPTLGTTVPPLTVVPAPNVTPVPLSRNPAAIVPPSLPPRTPTPTATPVLTPPERCDTTPRPAETQSTPPQSPPSVAPLVPATPAPVAIPLAVPPVQSAASVVPTPAPVSPVVPAIAASLAEPTVLGAMADAIGTRLAAVRGAFADLADRLEASAQSLKNGLLPEDGVEAKGREASLLFVELIETVEKSSTDLKVELPSGGLTSFEAIAGVLPSLQIAELERSELNQTRKAALAVLDRLDRMVCPGDAGFAPLAACHDAARTLRQAIVEASPSSLPSDAQRLIDGTHPIVALLGLITASETTPDAQWAAWYDVVEATFGHALAVAAARLKLVVRPI